MKKILLTLCIFALGFSAKAQTGIVFNELVPDPGSGNEEYIELYNTTGAAINVDCWTVVAYDFNAPGGVWVYNLPNYTIPAFGFMVISQAKPIDYKCGTFDSANIFSWNSASTTASLTHYERSGNNLINPLLSLTTDFITIKGGPSASLAIMLFNGTGSLVNGFFTNNGTTIPTEITTLNDLLINIPADAGSGCAATASLNFSGISAPEAEVLNVNAAVGNNNDYFRTRDGFCGAWIKGQSCGGSHPENSEFTPGWKNSGLAPTDPGSINITALPQACGNPNTPWNISVQIDDAGLVPGTYRIYSDMNYSHTLNAGDLQVATGPIPTTAVVSLPGVMIKTGTDAIVQVITASGCIVVTRVTLAQCAPLPVSFKSFTASRISSNVMVKWETATEINNSGFAVERNINGIWEQVAFVASQAVNGNSDAVLSYQFVDMNNTKGITQYRIRQIDLDAKSKYSETRAVRGEGGVGKTVVYPNPTNDGRVTVVFEDATSARNVSLMDMSGRTIKEWKAITNNNLQIENLNPGMYTLRIVIPETGEQAVEKIIVNKR